MISISFVLCIGFAATLLFGVFIGWYAHLLVFLDKDKQVEKRTKEGRETPIDQLFFTVSEGVISKTTLKTSDNIHKGRIIGGGYGYGASWYHIDVFDGRIMFGVRVNDDDTHKALLTAFANDQVIKLCFPTAQK
jgi:hypothetical protein